MTAPTLLILGAGGAVGRALLRRIPDDRRVVAVDRVPLAGIADSLVADLDDAGALAALAERIVGPVHLLHLAANLDNDQAHITRALRDNLLGVSTPISVFGARIAHLTFVSSISVYGAQPSNPIGEDQPLEPASPYATGKAAGEIVAAGLGRLFAAPATILRPTQLFGLHSARTTLPHQLVARMAAGEGMTLKGDPAQRRDYLWVGDLVDVLARQVEAPVAGTFNIGSGAPVTLQALFEAAAARFGAVFHRAPGEGGFDQWLDIAAARTKLGFRPRRPVLEWLATVDPTEPFA